MKVILWSKYQDTKVVKFFTLLIDLRLELHYTRLGYYFLV